MLESKEIEEIIIYNLRNLSLEKQNEVLDFVMFLDSKERKERKKAAQKKFVHPDGTPMSALEAAKEFAGCLDGGPGDLSTNKKYLQGPITE